MLLYHLYNFVEKTDNRLCIHNYVSIQHLQTFKSGKLSLLLLNIYVCHNNKNNDNNYFYFYYYKSTFIWSFNKH